MNPFTPDQKALLEEFWRISEEGWNAGWKTGIEFELWGIVLSGQGKCGHLTIEPKAVENLKLLSEKANGWFYWDNVEQEQWIETTAWKALYESQNNGSAQ